MGVLNPFAPKPPDKPEPEEEMATAELSEEQGLVAWEFLCLLDLGFTIEQAQVLVKIPHFSWHQADTLIKRGWPVHVVFDNLT